jgi:hypothetical protein
VPVQPRDIAGECRLQRQAIEALDLLRRKRLASVAARGEAAYLGLLDVEFN